MITIPCPSCAVLMSIEGEPNTEWECPICHGSFLVQQDDRGNLRFVIIESETASKPAPSNSLPVNPETPVDPHLYVIHRLTQGHKRNDVREELIQAGLPVDEAEAIVKTAVLLKKEKESHDKIMESLRTRFPDLIPMDRVPALYMFNGIGYGVLGERDPDPQTGTYVTTVFSFILYIPVFAFGAFRVADASPAESHLLGYFRTQSWRFFGRVPMSRLVKAYNWMVFLAIMSLVSYVFWKTR
jgi:hypothetical protein